jgi:hypothetical protein
LWYCCTGTLLDFLFSCESGSGVPQLGGAEADGRLAVLVMKLKSILMQKESQQGRRPNGFCTP